MIVEGVDPRDIRWEVDWPVYRVYFWHQPSAPGGIAQENVMWHCSEHRLSEVSDVEELLNWARNNARPEQTFVVYVEQRDAGRQGLVRLHGIEPNSATQTSGSAATARSDLPPTACATVDPLTPGTDVRTLLVP